MALTYPRTLPLAPRHVEFELQTSVGVTQSPWTKQMQVQINPGDIWLATWEYPPMERADAEELLGVLLSMRGMGETFLLGPTGHAKTPRGIGTGTPLVKGAGQTGYTLLTDGWTPSQTGILKIGDWFSLGFGGSPATGIDYLYKLAADADSDGSGNATLELCNRIRVATTDNDPITVNSPQGTFRLASNSQGFRINDAQHYGISLQAIEAI